MGGREPIGQKLRFEVFKRDSFTCQYCGAKAPDVVLQADHIHPVAEGGKTELLNLVTSCRACNSGKGARLLSDASVLERQREQIEELEERRQQLEMMLQWRDGLRDLAAAEVDAVASRIGEWTSLWPSAAGKDLLRKHIKQFGLAEVLAAAEEAFDQYVRREDGKVTTGSWSEAFGKIGAFAATRRRSRDHKNLPRILYIQGILRNRCNDRWLKCAEEIEDMHGAGASIELLEAAAREATSWSEFREIVDTAIGFPKGNR